MARRRPGLNPNFNLGQQMLDEQKKYDAIDQARQETLRGISKQRIAGGAEVDESGKPVINEETNRERRVDELPFLDTVHVAQIANKPDNPRNYGQGPSASTRLCSHKFVIDQPLFNIYGAEVGFIYVRFHKKGKRGTDWAYGPFSFETYKQFANSSSKGHFINTTLNTAHRPATPEEVAKYFGDFSPSSLTDSAGIRLD